MKSLKYLMQFPVSNLLALVHHAIVARSRDVKYVQFLHILIKQTSGLNSRDEKCNNC